MLVSTSVLTILRINRGAISQSAWKQFSALVEVQLVKVSVLTILRINRGAISQSAWKQFSALVEVQLVKVHESWCLYMSVLTIFQISRV